MTAGTGGKNSLDARGRAALCGPCHARPGGPHAWPARAGGAQAGMPAGVPQCQSGGMMTQVLDSRRRHARRRAGYIGGGASRGGGGLAFRGIYARCWTDGLFTPAIVNAAWPGRIYFVERAARKDARAQGCKIRRIDRRTNNAQKLLALGWRLTLGPNAGALTTSNIEGQMRGDAGAGDAGQCAELVEQLRLKPPAALIAVAFERRIDRSEKDVIRPKAEIDPRELLHAARGQSSEHQHHARDGHLADDQQAAQPMAAAGDGGRVLQQRQNLPPGRLPCGQ